MTTTGKPIPQLRSPHLKGALLLILALLAVFLLLKGEIEDGALTSSGYSLAASRGPFVQSPLNPTQVDELHHLVKHMLYKQLASLYVSRMTLSEALGQLFIVVIGYRYYGEDLE